MHSQTRACTTWVSALHDDPTIFIAYQPMEAKAIMKVRVARRPQGGLCVPLSEGPDTKRHSVTLDYRIVFQLFAWPAHWRNEHARWLFKPGSSQARLGQCGNHEARPRGHLCFEDLTEVT
jgi:hypothetical protein